MMDGRYKCTRCGGTQFYTEGQYVKCFKCNGMHCAPSRGELVRLAELDQLVNSNGLMGHYDDMRVFDDVIAVWGYNETLSSEDKDKLMESAIAPFKHFFEKEDGLKYNERTKMYDNNFDWED